MTCPLLPELITEGETVAEALANVEGDFRVLGHGLLVVERGVQQARRRKKEKPGQGIEAVAERLSLPAQPERRQVFMELALGDQLGDAAG